MASKTNDFVIADLRGGMNNQDPAHALPEDQGTLMLNVEIFNSTLGERRRGCEAIALTGSGLDAEDVIVHLATHFPKSTDSLVPELWAIAATLNSSTSVAQRVAGTWYPVTPVDAIDATSPYVLQIQSQSLHGKLYIMYKSGVDRAHVWDGAVLRRVGIDAPTDAPTAVDTANPGAFTGDRIYRVRFIKRDGSGTILLRSEPSPELTFTPSGTNDGATVTMPTLLGESETHWELEASDGDGNFYIIATTEIGTTSVDDTTQPATDYANFELSAAVGGYGLVPSAKFVIADQDRVIFGSDWSDPEKGARITWTPAFGSTGVGNDERIRADVDSFIDLDWMDGGELTGLSDPVNGSFYAFKLHRIYKVQRTGDANEAYEAFPLTKARGAIPGSVVSGVDEYGRGCVYFLDPSLGPSRISMQGLQNMRDLRQTWKSVNTNAELLSAHGVYYPDKQQLHWWVATEGEDTPNLKMINQISEIRSDEDGTTRGWTLADGTIATAWCSCIFPEVVNDEETGTTFLSYRPFIGMEGPNFIQRCDTQSTDAGDPYRAIIRSKPYFLVGLLNRWGLMNGALLADANVDEAVQLDVKLIRDFGAEENKITTDFVPPNSEESVVKFFDDLRMSNAMCVQVEFSDPE